MYNQTFQSFVPATQANNTNSTLSGTEQIQKLLFQAFKYQNSEYYDDALQKRNLQHASQQIVKIIQSMQKNPQFYMKVMPIMKQERELVQQTQYKQFWGKNQKVLCRNFQKNAYRALIMQQIKQMEERQIEKLNQKGVIFDEQNNMYSQNVPKSKKKKTEKTQKSSQKRRKYKSKSVQKPNFKEAKDGQLLKVEYVNVQKYSKDSHLIEQQMRVSVQLNNNNEFQDNFNIIGNNQQEVRHANIDESLGHQQINKNKPKKQKNKNK